MPDASDICEEGDADVFLDKVSVGFCDIVRFALNNGIGVLGISSAAIYQSLRYPLRTHVNILALNTFGAAKSAYFITLLRYHALPA